MSIAAVAIAVLAGITTYAESPVIICVEVGIDPLILHRSETIASRIFEDVGVQFDWRRGLRSCPAGAGTIRIRFETTTPAGIFPGALAFTRPYGESDIEIFYGRVQRTVEPPKLPSLLGHVLAHEITHILQGVDRHSDTGLMKPRWCADDYSQMAWKGLGFTEFDTLLLHRGLESRVSRLAAARARSTPNPTNLQ